MRILAYQALCLTALMALPPAGADEWWMQYSPVVTQPSDISELMAVSAVASRGGAYYGGWYGYWHLDDQLQTGARVEKPRTRRMSFNR